MSDSPSGQTRTPPALKWLLNERAAIAGKANRAAAQLEALNLRSAALQRRLDAVQANLSVITSRLATAQATLDALDASIALMYREVRANATGAVNAWVDEYGKRGGLEAFVLKLMQASAPLPVNSRDMRVRVTEHFHIPLVTRFDQQALQKSLQDTFRRLKDKGLIEPLHNLRKVSTPGTWRLKSAKTLADLVAQVAAMQDAHAEGLRPDPEEPAGTRDQPGIGSGAADPHTSRCEVAPQ